MKSLLKIYFLLSFIFCQSLPTKAEYFLSDLKRLDKIDEKTSSQIKKELKKIETKVKKQLIISYKTIEIKEAVTERVITSSSMSNRNKDLLLQATLQNPNMTPYEYEYLKQQLSQNTYGTRIISPREEIINNKILPKDKNIFFLSPKWVDIVEFYGGYSELGSKNINKTDWENGKFDISAKLTGIELISETECLANIDISGYLKLNKVPKNNYKYKGTYAIDDFSIYDIYKSNLPNVIFSFENKKYMPTSSLNTNRFTEPISSFVSEAWMLFDNHKSSITLMFDDLISNEVYNNVDDIKAFRIAEEKRREESRIAEEKRREQKSKKAIINEALILLEKDYDQRYVWRGTDKNNVKLYKILKGVKWVEPNFFNEKKSEKELRKELDEMKNYYSSTYSKVALKEREQKKEQQEKRERAKLWRSCCFWILMLLLMIDEQSQSPGS